MNDRTRYTTKEYRKLASSTVFGKLGGGSIGSDGFTVRGSKEAGYRFAEGIPVYKSRWIYDSDAALLERCIRRRKLQRLPHYHGAPEGALKRIRLLEVLGLSDPMEIDLWLPMM